MFIAKSLTSGCGFSEIEIGVFKLKNWDLETVKNKYYEDWNHYKNTQKYYPDEFEYTNADLEQIGTYKRNYSAFYRTFFPFFFNEKWYALYSSDYTATRIMSLPDCKDLGGEEPNAFGFCPVEFFVPYLDPNLKKRTVDFGFVSGCHWGDDSNWKLRYIDLSNVEKGIISVEERFGYIELPYNQRIREAVHFHYMEYGYMEINTPISFRVEENADGKYSHTEVCGYGMDHWKNVDDL